MPVSIVETYRAAHPARWDHRPMDLAELNKLDRAAVELTKAGREGEKERIGAAIRAGVQAGTTRSPRGIPRPRR